MTISELIKELEAIKEERGDMTLKIRKMEPGDEAPTTYELGDVWVDDRGYIELDEA